MVRAETITTCIVDVNTSLDYGHGVASVTYTQHFIQTVSRNERRMNNFLKMKVHW